MILAPVFAGLSEREARAVHAALDQYVENLADIEGEPGATDLDAAHAVLDRCTAAFCALAETPVPISRPKPSPPRPARTAPCLDSAAVTARAISRMLRRGGLAPFDVSRVGVGRFVSVHYDSRIASREQRLAKLAEASAFLADRGYVLDGRGWLECGAP